MPLQIRCVLLQNSQMAVWCSEYHPAWHGAGKSTVDRSTVDFAVEGEARSKIFNLMFALGEAATCLLQAWQSVLPCPG